LLLLFALGSVQQSLGCAASPPGGPSTPVIDPKCQLNSKNEKAPGYPFDIAKFKSDVIPVLVTGCGAQGCHGSPNGSGGYVVWADAATNDCNQAQTFNAAIGKIDLATPENSQLTAAVDGGLPGHTGGTLQATDAKLITLKSFITTAAALYAADGGGVAPPPTNSVFDFAVFQSTIQPVFNQGGCAAAACHAVGTGNFTLKPTPTAAADITANFAAISTRTNLLDPSASIILHQATTLHGSGRSTQVSADGAAKLLAWITAAKNNAPASGDASCAPVAKFNLGTFSSEVLPILNGSLDLNVGLGRGAGCMSTQCHGGAVTGPGKLDLSSPDPAVQLQSFACFVKLDAPTQSEALLCPTDQAGCRKRHPGQEVFNGASDLNYQRILAFIYGSGAVNPLDYAFFARRINTLFDDVNVVQAGATSQTCADTFACHGISVAGQPPPNNSDFPIIANAGGDDDARLSVNFVAATQFVTFLNPTESSLFLYPTNEIANKNAHRFATGIDHPGGLDFAANSDEAKLILKWAAGLRPDGNGFLRDWLVLGDFSALTVADHPIDETALNPKIFKIDGGSFNLSAWDGFFSDSANIDLNTPFPKVGATRIAYASAFLLNTLGNTQPIQMQVVTNNAIQIYLNGALVAQNDNSGGASLITTLAGSGAGSKAKVVIKLLQRANDAQFAFTAQLKDDQGTLLTDVVGGIVITLSDNGGI
jgi:hypothetical protein